jgi:hypothetical protein
MDASTEQRLPLGHRPPLLDEQPKTLFAWLAERGMTGVGGAMDLADAELLNPDPQRPPLLDGVDFALAEPTARGQRVKPLDAKQRKALKQRFENTAPAGVAPEAVWQAQKVPELSVRVLNWAKLPADAMAFYRPFHFPPFPQWGIYLLLGPLLAYIGRLQQLAADLKLYSPEVLAHLVLFEVFHHEFFHHMAECTATWLEVLGAAYEDETPVYLNYRRRTREDGFGHPHAPLEEALANAYAHNALGFVSRIKAGYKTAAVKSYQKALEQHWRLEPPGYSSAAGYIGGGYVAGAACLVAQMIGEPEAVDQAPLACIAKHLMPNGFTALVPKPEIPTYLVGSAAELKYFQALVPAPNEAYTTLFWPYRTAELDAYVQQRRKEEQAQRKAARGSGTAADAGQTTLATMR